MKDQTIIFLMRHGMTQGNREHRYVGSTDESILPEESDRLRSIYLKLNESVEFKDISAAAVGRVYTSPLRRCIRTAGILFPNTDHTVVPGFRECDFGEFEYMNYKELNGNADYQRYIDSGGACGFPGGETLEEFEERTCRAFLNLPEIRYSGKMSPSFRSIDIPLQREHHFSDMYEKRLQEDPSSGIYENIQSGKRTSSGIYGNIKSEERTSSGIYEMIPSQKRSPVIAIVAHGGTIMAIMDRFSQPHRDYFDWQVKNGEGFICSWDSETKTLHVIKTITGSKGS